MGAFVARDAKKIMMTQSITATITALAQRARTAALELAQLSSQQKNKFLEHLAQA